MRVNIQLEFFRIKWTMMKHSPYSPDTPCDFCIFPKLRCFQCSDRMIVIAVHIFFRTLDENTYCTCFQKWVLSVLLWGGRGDILKQNNCNSYLNIFFDPCWIWLQLLLNILCVCVYKHIYIIYIIYYINLRNYRVHLLVTLIDCRRARGASM